MSDDIKTVQKRVGDGTPGPGRPKGTQNKTTRLAKQAIEQAAEGLGGVDRLIAWAQEAPENEKVFWSSMYTKLIPVQTELSGPDGGPIKHAAQLTDEQLAAIASGNAR